MRPMFRDARQRVLVFVANAVRYLEAGRARGKVVVVPDR
jgi:hypothetical protein